MFVMDFWLLVFDRKFLGTVHKIYSDWSRQLTLSRPWMCFLLMHIHKNNGITYGIVIFCVRVFVTLVTLIPTQVPNNPGTTIVQFMTGREF